MEYIFVLICVVFLAAGQLLFKRVGSQLSNITSLILDPNIRIFFFSALALYGTSTLLWIWALRTLPLSKAYPFMALGFLIVPIAAYYAFGEPLTYKHLVGSCVIVAGIFIISAA